MICGYTMNVLLEARKSNSDVKKEWYEFLDQNFDQCQHFLLCRNDVIVKGIQ
jgi:hypothetical protein